MKLGPTMLEQYAKEQMIDAMIKGALNIIALVAGAVLISMAYQSWEVGIGAACLVFFHKVK
jgi:hypothetical protein